ncbi:MAG: hypothetical protein RIR51_1001, partial [Bacteroidota bacterium]
GDLNAVTVTTIHKSKGLEFPIVFLPFFMDNLEPNLNRNVPEKWINMDILEDDEIISINEDLRLSASKIKLNYLKNENVRPELKGIFEEEQKKITLDLMNAYYVATTRAGSKLYIYSQLPKENNFESFHLESLLYSFVSNNSQFIDVSKEDSSNIIYKMIPLPEEIVDEKETKVSNILDFDFHLKLQEKPNLRVIHDKKELYNKNERRRLLGNIIHDILANQTDKEFENELNLKEEELFEEIIFNIEKLKLDPKFSFIFNNENLILAEKDIILNEEKILRPDRVIKFEDIFYVIDFKTGNPSESHKKQVNNYKEVLEMMGYHPVRPVLVYLKSAHVEYV